MPSVVEFIGLVLAASHQDMDELKRIGKEVANAERKRSHLAAAQLISDAVDVASSGAGYDRVSVDSADS